MHVAARRGKLQIIKYLAEYGANIFTLDHNRHTPMDEAAVCGHDEVIQVLDRYSAKLSHDARKRWKKKAEKVYQKSLDSAAKRDRKDRKSQLKIEAQSRHSVTTVSSADSLNVIQPVRTQSLSNLRLEDSEFWRNDPPTKSFPVMARFDSTSKRERIYKKAIDNRKLGLFHRKGFGELTFLRKPQSMAARDSPSNDEREVIKDQQKDGKSELVISEGQSKPADAVWTESERGNSDIVVIRMKAAEKTTPHPELIHFLTSHGLLHTLQFFQDEFVDMRSLDLIEKEDLLHYGMRERTAGELMKAIDDHRTERVYLRSLVEGTNSIKQDRTCPHRNSERTAVLGETSRVMNCDSGQPAAETIDTRL